MTTKHEQIIQHIIRLEVGKKISVRQIAKSLNVSEGTAYRAIKEAENQGLVSTIERVGTIRIERKKKDNFEQLTYAERSEEHTSELQSRGHLVCRLLLEKKKNNKNNIHTVCRVFTQYH